MAIFFFCAVSLFARLVSKHGAFPEACSPAATFDPWSRGSLKAVVLMYPVTLLIR